MVKINSLQLMGATLFFAAFLLSLVLTLVVRAVSLKAGFVARPRQDRFNIRTVPLGGGMAIFWTISIVILAGTVFVKYFLAEGRVDFFDDSVTVHARGYLSKLPDITIVVVAAALLHLIGLLDDVRGLGPILKLFCQFFIALLTVLAANIRVEFFIESEVITIMLSVVWIVLLMNVFNFLDNMDGCSAGIAVIVSVVLFTAAAISGQVFISGLALATAGTLMGFLVFNFPPAKIFMGDSGSLVVGFFVAVLTLRTTYFDQDVSTNYYSVLLPLVVLAVPLYDFISVTLLRLSQGKSPFVGDTQHFSHRIKRRGLTDTQTALTLYLATTCTAISGVVLYQVNSAGAILVFAQTVMILLIIAILEMTGGNGGSDG